MGAQIYDKEAITRYLLGTLPEAEAQRFDELSLADDDFANALNVAEYELVDAYVQGALIGDAAEHFQTHYLASPRRRDKVEFAQVFRGWSEKSAIELSAELNPQELGEKRKDFGWFASLGIFSTPRSALQWGFAASALALFVVVGLLVFQNMRLREQMTNTQSRQDQLLQREGELQKQLEVQRSTNAQTEQELARVQAERKKLEQELRTAQQEGTSQSVPGDGRIVSLILAPPLRGAGQPPSISVSPGTNLVAAQLQLETADYPAYRVALIDPGVNQSLWRSGNLKPKARGGGKTLRIAFRAGLLRPRNYILRVSGVAANGASEIIGDYSFKVVK